MLSLGLGLTLSSCSALFGIELLPLRHEEGDATGGETDGAGAADSAGKGANTSGRTGDGGASGRQSGGDGGAGEGGSDHFG
ncbi:MAG TPA: hypothetical protein VGK73_31060, partial [Polyangiaceae bacterium]